MSSQFDGPPMGRPRPPYTDRMNVGELSDTAIIADAIRSGLADIASAIRELAGPTEMFPPTEIGPT